MFSPMVLPLYPARRIRSNGLRPSGLSWLKKPPGALSVLWARATVTSVALTASGLQPAPARWALTRSSTADSVADRPAPVPGVAGVVGVGLAAGVVGAGRLVPLPGVPVPVPLPGTWSRRSGDPAPAPCTPLTARAVTVWATSAGEAADCFSSTRAATPATCGDAIEVPESVAVALSDADESERIELPGANTSRQLP